MATKPELNIAEYGKDISSVQYNDNFDKLNDYIEAISEELMLKVNTINSQLSSNVLSNLQSIYPVGSLYIGTTDTCPIANLFGTWEKVSEGRVLQGVSSSQVAGETVEAGLPNITATARFNDGPSKPIGLTSATGAIYGTDNRNVMTRSESGWNLPTTMNFDASRSNAIYGNSNTVQPPAYLVNIWKRTA